MQKDMAAFTTHSQYDPVIVHVDCAFTSHTCHFTSVHNPASGVSNCHTVLITYDRRALVEHIDPLYGQPVGGVYSDLEPHISRATPNSDPLAFHLNVPIDGLGLPFILVNRKKELATIVVESRCQSERPAHLLWRGYFEQFLTKHFYYKLGVLPAAIAKQDFWACISYVEHSKGKALCKAEF